MVGGGRSDVPLVHLLRRVRTGVGASATWHIRASSRWWTSPRHSHVHFATELDHSKIELFLCSMRWATRTRTAARQPRAFASVAAEPAPNARRSCRCASLRVPRCHSMETDAMRRPIAPDEHVAIGAMLWQMQDDLRLITNTVGPAYGAAMCDRARRVNRSIHAQLFALSAVFRSEANPYEWRNSYTPLPSPAVAREIIRRRATTIIGPPIPYEPYGPLARGLNNPLTFREHLVVGAMLVQMHDDLMFLHVNKLQHAYGRTHAICQRARQAVQRLASLRSALDGQVCAEHPLPEHEIESIRITHAYYGHTRPDSLRPIARSFLAPPRVIRLAAT